MSLSRAVILIVGFCVVSATYLGWKRYAESSAVPVASPWSNEALAGRIPGPPLSRVKAAAIMTTFCKAVGQPAPSIIPSSMQVGVFDIDLPYRAPAWLWHSHGTVIQVADGSGIIVKYSDSFQGKDVVPATPAAIIARGVFILQRAGVYSYLEAQPNPVTGRHAPGEDWTLFWPKKGAGSDENLNGVLLILSSSGDLRFLKVDCSRPGGVVTS